jgi:hypothetical protein
MAVSLKHKFVSPKLDSPDSTKVQPSNWNDQHDLLIGANSVLGRGAGVGDAAAVEIPTTTTGRSLMAAADAAAALAIVGGAPASAGTTTTTVGAAIHAAAAKTTPVDADTMPLIDSAAANVLKKVTWANIKATLKAAIADVWAANANKFLTTDVIETSSAYIVLAASATPTINWNTGINFDLTLNSNAAFQTPSNAQPGTYRTVMVKGNSATLRQVTFGAAFQGDVPTLTDVSSSKWYDLTIKCISAGHFTVSSKRAKG